MQPKPLLSSRHSADGPPDIAADAPPALPRNLPLLLLQGREAVIGRFRPILNAHGITEQQWRVVRELLARGALEPREIVGICGISSPSLAGVLARMEQTGLVRRERLGHDQRRVKVSPTARSRALAARMAPQIEAAYADIEALVGAPFLGALHGTLDRLIAMLGDAEGPQGTVESRRPRPRRTTP